MKNDKMSYLLRFSIFHRGRSSTEKKNSKIHSNESGGMARRNEVVLFLSHITAASRRNLSNTVYWKMWKQFKYLEKR